MDGFETYVVESDAPAARKGRRLAVYLGLAVLLAAASLIAVNGRDGAESTFPRVIMPGSGSACDGTPGNGFEFSSTTDGVAFRVCISQQGNINRISYPTAQSGHNQIAFDGYCIASPAGTMLAKYKDYSPGSGVSSAGFGPATFTQTATEVFNVTRDTLDGKFRLTQFIKVSIQPRSIFVGMTVRNLDSVSRDVVLVREVAPAIDGNAADDQYNVFGRTGSGEGATGQAFQATPVGANSLLFGPTQDTARVRTASVANFQALAGCASYVTDPPGPVTGGNRVLVGFVNNGLATTIAPGASANLGKFMYRML
jgi:hypothetical protein